MSCTVCNHPQRQAIDEALLARTATLAQLSEQHHLSTSALHRHKQHLQKKMQQVSSRFQDLLSEGWLVILNSFLELIIRAAQTAGAEGNNRLLLQAVRQGTGIIKFMHKLSFPLAPDTVHRLFSSPEWADHAGLLPTDPKFLLGSRQALAHSLASSCPEPGSDQDTDSVPGLGELAERTNLNENQLLYLLTEMFPSLGAPESDSPPPKREKGGEKPAKTPNSNNNYEQYRKDKLCEKNAGEIPPAIKNHLENLDLRPGKPSLKGQIGSLLFGPKTSESTRSWIQDLDEGRLDVNLLHAIGAGRPIDLDLARSAAA